MFMNGGGYDDSNTIVTTDPLANASTKSDTVAAARDPPPLPYK